MNIKDELVNFPAIDIDALSENGTLFPDNIVSAVGIYNKARDRIAQGVLDIAMIELKKAIGLFPEFYDAIVLLGTCKYATGDKIGAIKLFNSIEDENEKERALDYLDKMSEEGIDAPGYRRSSSENDFLPDDEDDFEKEYANIDFSMHEEDDYPIDRPVRKSNQSAAQLSKAKTTYKRKPQNNNQSKVGAFLDSIANNPKTLRIIGIVAGALVIVLLFTMLIMALTGKSGSNPVSSQEYTELNQKYESEKVKREKAESDLKALQDKNSVLYDEVLEIIEEKYNNKNQNYESIVKLISSMDTGMIKDSVKRARVDAIYSDVSAIFVTNKNADGSKAFNNGNFSDAITAYSDIVKYVPNYDKMNTVLLALGKSYVGAERINEAVATFKQLVEAYPNSTEAAEAKNILNELNIDATFNTLPPESPTIAPSAPVDPNTPTKNPTPTKKPTQTPDNSSKPTEKPTQTPKPTETPTQSPTDTVPPTESPTQTPTQTPTSTPTPTETPTETPTQSPTETVPPTVQASE